MNDSRGFTLIELMVTLVILAVLAAIALPAYQSYVARQKLAVAEADLVSLSMNMENFLQNNTRYPSATASLTNWTPVQVADFSYAITSVTQPSSSANGTYSLQASGTSQQLLGCRVTLDSSNTRVLSGCPGGGTSW